MPTIPPKNPCVAMFISPFDTLQLFISPKDIPTKPPCADTLLFIAFVVLIFTKLVVQPFIPFPL